MELTTVSVKFPDTGQLYTYMAPVGWSLRRGDIVRQEDMFSDHAVVVNTGIAGPRRVKVLDSFERQMQTLELFVPHGYKIAVTSDMLPSGAYSRMRVPAGPIVYARLR